MNEKGWIKLNRKILEWQWYKDGNTFRVFIHLLLNANAKDGAYRSDTIHRGDVITTISEISEELKLTYDQTRTALEHLKETNEVTIKRRPKYLVISIVKYNDYQDRPNHIPIKNGEDCVDSVKKLCRSKKQPTQIPITEFVGTEGIEGDLEGGNPTEVPIKSQSNPNQIPIKSQQYKNNKKLRKKENNIYTADEKTDYGGVFLSDKDWDELKGIVKDDGEFIKIIDRVGDWLGDNPRPIEKHKSIVKTFMRNDGWL